MQVNFDEFDDNILNIFKVEAEEILQKFNDNLLKLEKNPEEKNVITESLRLIHSLKGATGMVGFKTIQEIAHKLEDILSEWKHDYTKVNPQCFPILYEICDNIYILIEKSVEQKSDYKCKNINILFEKLNNNNITVNSPKIIPDSIDIQEIKTVRVDIQKLDNLLTIVKNHLYSCDKISKLSDTTIDKLHDSIETLKNESLQIKNIIEGMRKLPLAVLFHAFPRMIRDMEKETGKQIELIISGSNTLVDKTIIDGIKIPLIQLLRNAVAHGIEPPDERLRQGKNPTGIIKIFSKQDENNIIITIEDDGHGIDVEKVKKIAVEKGFISAKEIDYINSHKIINLLFSDGFSTKDTVTELSGRGIGLDIVKTNIDKLNGIISLNSDYNKGAKFTIYLPL